MDSNKEEAEHCVRIARAAIDSGNLVRARRLLLKAQRLYPSPEIQELLSSQFENEDVEPIFSRFSSTSSSTGHSVAQPENAEASTQSASASEPSEDQVEIVRRVKRTVDYYAILGLETGCSEEEVKKAYRKLSLKVHPDKNKAPGAEEAFKLVSRAFQCLSDPELRLRYDRYGPEEARRLSHDTGMRQRRHNDVFFEEFDPNEIFQNFFFGGQGFGNGGPSFQFRRAYVRTQNRGRDFGVHTAEVRPGNMLMFVQLLSIIVLFFISYFPYSQPIYSLEMKDSYKFAKVTKDHGVNYYVNSATFDRDYPPDSHPRMQIERQAERDYKVILVQKCRAEMNLHYFGRIKEMPNCVKLEEFPKVF